jgi:iron complex transport system substrate-binding protein
MIDRVNGLSGNHLIGSRSAASTAMLTFVCMFVATSLPSYASAATITDDAGHAFSTERPVMRVVALAPHLTELVYAAGGGDKLVAVTRFSDYPAAARSLPQVGDAFAINFEAIVALKPDLILVWHSGLAQRQRERLESLGLPIFDSQIDGVAGISNTVRRLGALLHTDAVAEPAAVRIDARWQSMAARYRGLAPVRVFYQLASEPLMTVNGQHLISRTIESCGGTNAFAALPTLVPTISWEAAAASNPQLIVATAAPGRPADLGRWPALTQVDAVRTKQIAALPPDLLSRMGPRFVDGAELLCEAIDKTRRIEHR